MRIGGTNYEPADRRWSTSHAQSIFLSSIKSIAPEVIDELRDAPFKSFMKIFFEFAYLLAPRLCRYDISFNAKGNIDGIAAKKMIKDYVFLEDLYAIPHILKYVLYGFGLNATDTSTRKMKIIAVLCGNHAIGKSESSLENIDRSIEENIYLKSLSKEDKALELAIAMVALREQIFAWQQSHHLETKWMIERIIGVLIYWAVWPQHWENTETPFSRSSREPFDEDPGRFAFEYLGVTFPYKSLSETETGIRQGFENQLKDYINRLQSNLVETPEKYTLIHFEWLARFQVQGWSKNRIAQRYNVDRASVREGIKSVAALANLPLRQSL